MLQTFRDNLRGTVAIILVGLICIPFALFGIDSLFNTQATAKPVAEVNGEEISETELQRAIQMRRSQLTQQFGENLPPQFISDERLRQPVLESLVQRAAMLQSAKAEGMTVGSTAVDQIILNSSDFQVDGKFDSNRYQALIRSIGYTNQSYKSVIEKEIVLNQYASGLSQSNFALTAEVDTLATINLQTRSFDYLVLSDEPYLSEVEISDEEIESYYQENQNRYLSPETVEIEALELSSRELAASIEVDESRIEEEYQQEQSTFQSATQRRASHILLDVEAEDHQTTLDTIYQRLDEGVEFAELAKTYSQDFGSKDSGGDVGYSTGDSFVPEFESALAALSVGEVSQPIETEFGVHIIKLMDISESALPTLDEMRLSIADRIRQAEADEIFIEKLNDFKDLTYNVDDLGPVAQQLGLSLWESEAFSRFSGNGLASNPQIIEAAFSEELIQSGFTSDPIELDEQTVVVIRVKAHSPESTKPLDDVREAVTTAIKTEKARQLLADAVASVVEKAKSGESLSQQAEALSVELSTVEEASRQQPDVEPSVMTKVFSLPFNEDGSVYDSVQLPAGGIAVIALNGVQQGDLSSVTDAEKTAAMNQIGMLLGEADLLSVRDYLVEQATVEYN